jgi:hypothetical protein
MWLQLTRWFMNVFITLQQWFSMGPYDPPGSHAIFLRGHR